MEATMALEAGGLVGDDFDSDSESSSSSESGSKLAGYLLEVVCLGADIPTAEVKTDASGLWLCHALLFGDSTVGRVSSKADIGLQHATVSTKHATVTVLRNGAAEITDMGSTNKTRVKKTLSSKKSRRCKPQRNLHHGFYIAFGEVWCRFLLAAAMSDAEKQRCAHATVGARLREDASDNQMDSTRLAADGTAVSGRSHKKQKHASDGQSADDRSADSKSGKRMPDTYENESEASGKKEKASGSGKAKRKLQDTAVYDESDEATVSEHSHDSAKATRALPQTVACDKVLADTVAYDSEELATDNDVDSKPKPKVKRKRPLPDTVAYDSQGAEHSDDDSAEVKRRANGCQKKKRPLLDTVAYGSSDNDDDDDQSEDSKKKAVKGKAKDKAMARKKLPDTVAYNSSDNDDEDASAEEMSKTKKRNYSSAKSGRKLLANTVQYESDGQRTDTDKETADGSHATAKRILADTVAYQSDADAIEDDTLHLDATKDARMEQKQNGTLSKKWRKDSCKSKSKSPRIAMMDTSADLGFAAISPIGGRKKAASPLSLDLGMSPPLSDDESVHGFDDAKAEKRPVVDDTSSVSSAATEPPTRDETAVVKKKKEKKATASGRRKSKAKKKKTTKVEMAVDSEMTESETDNNSNKSPSPALSPKRKTVAKKKKARSKVLDDDSSEEQSADSRKAVAAPRRSARICRKKKEHSGAEDMDKEMADMSLENGDKSKAKKPTRLSKVSGKKRNRTELVQTDGDHSADGSTETKPKRAKATKRKTAAKTKKKRGKKKVEESSDMISSADGEDLEHNKSTDVEMAEASSSGKRKTAAKRKTAKTPQKSRNAKTEESSTSVASSSSSPRRSARMAKRSTAVVILHTGAKESESRDALLRKMEELGADVLHLKSGWQNVDDLSALTHLVCNAPMRTEKFICGLPYAAHIVTDAWMRACVKAADIEGVDESRYFPKGKQTKAVERKFGFVLRDSFEVCRNVSEKLFNGKSLYLSKGIGAKFKGALTNMWTANGGAIRKTAVSKSSKGCFVVGLDPSVKDMADAKAKGAQVFNHNLIVTSVLRQRIDLDDAQLQLTEKIEL